MATGAVLVLFGALAFAPTALSDSAFSDELSRFDSAQTNQRFTAAFALSPALPLRVSELEEMAPLKPAALFTLQQFMFSGVINWGGYKFTYYSQQVLPGGGLAIPGRHVNEGGYVSDGDGFIVLAGSAPLGTVYDTPFGYQGKIYDRGTAGNHLDVYIR